MNIDNNKTWIVMSTSPILTSLKGLSAVITGGSSGLGYATMERLTKQGCIVAILDIQEPKELPTNSYFILADVTKEENILKALDIIEKKVGKIDILVNCAGIFLSSQLFNQETEISHRLDDFERVMKVNVTGTFNMIRLCCKLFYKNEPNEYNQKGVVINVGSTAGCEAPYNYVAYATSKAAIIGMTLPLARDLSLIGVRVVTIAPSIFETSMTEPIPKQMIKCLIEEVPCPKRLGHPDEFAHLVQSIVENQMLNGEVIRLDGGVRIAP